MTVERLRALIDAYGGDPARFPAEERDAARALLAASAEARALADEARRLDALIDRLEPGPAPDLEAMIAAATRTPQEANVVAFRPKTPGRSAAFWGRASALAAAGVFGFVIGFGDEFASNDALALLDAASAVEDGSW